MTALTMLQSKISRTKRRLSEGAWYPRIQILTILGLLIIMAFALRSVSMSNRFGVVEAEIPVLPSDEFPIPGSDRKVEVLGEIHKHVAVVILTGDEFLFGDLESFSTDLTNVRNKFFIKHKDGAPDLTGLFEAMDKWSAQNASMKKTDLAPYMVFMPMGDIPMPIVIQVIAGIKENPLFNKVILASGMI